MDSFHSSVSEQMAMPQCDSDAPARVGSGSTDYGSLTSSTNKPMKAASSTSTVYDQMRSSG